MCFRRLLIFAPCYNPQVSPYHTIADSWFLLPLFFALASFVFISLQTLLPKYRGWGCLCDISALSASRCYHPSSIFKSFVFLNLQIPFPVTPFAAHLYKTPGCHPCSGLSITLPPSHSWTLALFSSLLTLSREQSIAAQQITVRRSVAGDLDSSLRSLRTLVALRADRVATHHCSLRFAGWPARQAALGGADRSRHRHPGRHDRFPHARVSSRRELSLRRSHRPDEHRLDRGRRRISLRHLGEHRRLRDHESLGRRHFFGPPPATAPGRLLLRRLHRRLRGIRLPGGHRRRLHDRPGLQALPRRRAQPDRQHS